MATRKATLDFELKSATCRYRDVEAVKKVSLTIQKGEQIGFIGPSGSGKTTLLRLINTMRAPSEGSVFVFGTDVSTLGAPEMRSLRSRIATIPQDLGLVANLTVIQNVILGKGGKRGTLGSMRDIISPSKSDILEIHNILERVGIGEKLYTRTSQLSGGQQQRVAIARALYQQPEALIADEPVSSVDPARAHDTVKLLCDLSKEGDFTLCVSLHNIDLAKEFFPRLVGMRSGEIALDGSPSEIDGAEFTTLYRLSDSEMMRDA